LQAGDNNTATAFQEGGVDNEIYQEQSGSYNEATTYQLYGAGNLSVQLQSGHGSNESPNTSVVTQWGLGNVSLTDQSGGAGNAIEVTQGANYNFSKVIQAGVANQATVNQNVNY
jgi:hypothetical protein